MATTIKVTPQDLEHASSQIESLANDYKNEYEALCKWYAREMGWTG